MLSPTVQDQQRELSGYEREALRKLSLEMRNVSICGVSVDGECDHYMVRKVHLFARDATWQMPSLLHHIDRLEAELRECRAKALEEAANLVVAELYPKNPEDDWTDFARIRAHCARRAESAIRAKITQGAQHR